MASDPVSYILLLDLFDALTLSRIIHLFLFLLSGYGQFFNDSIYDHNRVEYLSGYICSTLTALRYICIVFFIECISLVFH
jgi:hypothetical protein